MSKRAFTVLQTVPVPTGSESFEKKRAEILATFSAKVPEEYHIPQHYIDHPPRDVTSIPRDCGILTAEELEITESYDAIGLASAIAARRYTAVAVARAFCKRAIVCHQITCCLNQWFPELAEKQAEALDQHLDRTGKTIGPLHGVPISIKQHIPVAGTWSDSAMMDTAVLDDSDALMVSILRRLGAVFYVKTNQPQSGMHLESDSHLGRVLNPSNIALSAGGSTGGEAALVALRGSVLGVGTDIGGSVRGPAGKCGIYGFKPTTYTLPMRDFFHSGALPAELQILCSTGPLCRSLRDMDTFMRLILAEQPHLSDPRVIPIPWTGLKTDISVSVDRPLKIGVMMTDGMITPQPPVTRAMQWAISRLETSPLVRLHPFQPLRTVDAMATVREMYWPDGGAAIRDVATRTGEPLHPLTEWTLRGAGRTTQKTALEVVADRARRDAFRCAFAEHWSVRDVDVVLCPVYVGPAPAHDTSWYWNYTAIWNLVDYPGVVFPTPVKAMGKGQEEYATAPLGNEEDACVRRLWEENDYEGAPIALQLVARKHYDNFLFGAFDILKEPLQLV